MEAAWKRQGAAAGSGSTRRVPLGSPLAPLREVDRSKTQRTTRALQAGGRRFEPCTAHLPQSTRRERVTPSSGRRLKARRPPHLVCFAARPHLCIGAPLDANLVGHELLAALLADDDWGRLVPARQVVQDRVG